jgi:putative SOS response-associated peptidase YedK
MCGRFTREYTWRQVHDFLNLQFPPDTGADPAPSFNVAPMQQVPVCINSGGVRHLAMLTWGLVPSWSTDGKPLLNARSETVRTSPAFRAGFKSRRCIVPATGFFEWRTLSGQKQPRLFRCINDPLFAFASVWEPAPDSRGTFTILTTTPNRVVETVHDRMPVILRAQNIERWMAKDPPDETETKSLFEPFPAEEMESFDVSDRVNSPKNNDPSLVERLPPQTLFG